MPDGALDTSAMGIWPAEVPALVLASATALFLSNLGFLLLELGSSNLVDLPAIAYKRLSAVAVCTIVYTVVGYDIATGPGKSWFAGMPGHIWQSFQPEEAARLFLQLMGATLVISAMMGSISLRTRLTSLLVIVTAVSFFLYPVVQYWVWNERGWLNSGFKGFGDNPLFGTGMWDQGGSGVIHLTLGVVSGVCCVMLGKRVRFTSLSSKASTSFNWTAIGFLIVWFSWFGISPAISQTPERSVPLTFLNTFLCPSVHALASPLISRFRGVTTIEQSAARLIDSCMFGLVTILAGAGVIHPLSAVALGLLSACMHPLFAWAVNKVGIDDVTGCVSIHAGGGICGLIGVAIFAPDVGIIYGRGSLLAAQLVGALAILTWVSSSTFLVCLLTDAFLGLRVSYQEETGQLSKDLNLVKAYTLPLSHDEDSQEELQRLNGFFGYLRKRELAQSMNFLLSVVFFKRKVSDESYSHSSKNAHTRLMRLARTLYTKYFADGENELGLGRAMVQEVATEMARQHRRGVVDLGLGVIFDECALLVESELNPHWLSYQDLWLEYMQGTDQASQQITSWLRSTSCFKQMLNRRKTRSNQRKVGEMKRSSSPSGKGVKYFYTVDETNCEVLWSTRVSDSHLLRQSSKTTRDKGGGRTVPGGDEKTQGLGDKSVSFANWLTSKIANTRHERGSQPERNTNNINVVFTGAALSQQEDNKTATAVSAHERDSKNNLEGTPSKKKMSRIVTVSPTGVMRRFEEGQDVDAHEVSHGPVQVQIPNELSRMQVQIPNEFTEPVIMSNPVNNNPLTHLDMMAFSSHSPKGPSLRRESHPPISISRGNAPQPKPNLEMMTSPILTTRTNPQPRPNPVPRTSGSSSRTPEYRGRTLERDTSRPGRSTHSPALVGNPGEDSPSGRATPRRAAISQSGIATPRREGAMQSRSESAVTDFESSAAIHNKRFAFIESNTPSPPARGPDEVYFHRNSAGGTPASLSKQSAYQESTRRLAKTEKTGDIEGKTPPKSARREFLAVEGVADDFAWTFSMDRGNELSMQEEKGSMPGRNSPSLRKSAQSRTNEAVDNQDGLFHPDEEEQHTDGEDDYEEEEDAVALSQPC